MTAGPLVVVGDALLDEDIEGAADRLCPDAPVPVVRVGRHWQRPGGAGLAARLAARSAPDVVLISALGADEAGRRVAALLDGQVSLVALPMDGDTPRKTRVRAAGQPVVRLDRGEGTAATRPLTGDVPSALHGAGAVLVADYGRGTAAHADVRRYLARAAGRVPVVWDPHPRGAEPVPGVRLATPNLDEAEGLAGPGEPGELAERLRRRWGCDGVAVTLGADGAVLAEAGRVYRIPVPASARVPAGARPDTCGAGDRFASAVAAALWEGARPRDAVTVAVESAARFVAAGAATALSEPAREAPAGTASAFAVAERVRRHGGTLVATGGCFDLLHPGHVGLLARARSFGDALVVCLNSDDSVRGLKGPDRPIVPAEDRARLLLALSDVDAVVVFDEPSPAGVLERLAPDVWVKGGDYAGADLPEAEVVRRHGGRVELVPLVAGYSTTRLLTTTRNGEAKA
ncbi:PfkB family carbohydrate kinase [Amycolatopsis suaedae]|uniref:Bifunctional heptose 7-phosphate kinase/heptose 1-phosphate adenyltransferase n=1 Tax=Amycolatopsis suaedae TaxID=2510978 RepID=A0A4Q7J2N8_9PSEU|nr:PfkB family carbohydrate kinase [Amycolatopsis suaedae]RZQ60224.1 bifunctional heptose 7-phosphate kinase/heptose 1-phosphate adenyltransferase [Amycolatopsis suaedae]